MPDGLHRESDDGDRGTVGPRAFWSGTLTFGLVSIPVDLYSAQRASGPHLRMLADDGTPLARVYVDPTDEREVSADEIVRGYEVEPEEHVVVSDEELEALEPEKSRDIHLRRFVPEDAISPVYFRRAYYLAPAGQSTRAYAVLAQTMERTRRAGVATFVMRGKEHLVAIFARGGVLRAQTLRFADEVRSPADVGLEAPPAPSAEARRRMEKALAKLTTDTIPLEPFRDRRAEAIAALARAKLERGEDVVEHEVPEPEPATWEPPDLARLLKERLAEGQARSTAAAGAPSKSELYRRAKELGIEGRSRMSREELARAVREAAGS
ncbi:MAG TPA: Ku protein [Sandaracinaceae bacterium]